MFTFETQFKKIEKKINLTYTEIYSMHTMSNRFTE